MHSLLWLSYVYITRCPASFQPLCTGGHSRALVVLSSLPEALLLLLYFSPPIAGMPLICVRQLWGISDSHESRMCSGEISDLIVRGKASEFLDSALNRIFSSFWAFIKQNIQCSSTWHWTMEPVYMRGQSRVLMVPVKFILVFSRPGCGFMMQIATSNARLWFCFSFQLDSAGENFPQKQMLSGRFQSSVLFHSHPACYPLLFALDLSHLVLLSEEQSRLWDLYHQEVWLDLAHPQYNLKYCNVKHISHLCIRCLRGLAGTMILAECSSQPQGTLPDHNPCHCAILNSVHRTLP